jgi:hypothetical protein
LWDAETKERLRALGEDYDWSGAANPNADPPPTQE